MTSAPGDDALPTRTSVQPLAPATPSPASGGPPLGTLEARAISPHMTRMEREFLLLVIFVYAQHGHIDRAGVLLESLYLLGEYTPEVMVGRTTLRFYKKDWAGALACLEELDRMDPMERFGDYRLTERQRMRRYIKARCLFELQEKSRARDAVDVYMRHGRSDDR